MLHVLCILLKAMLTLVHCIVFTIYICKSVFEINIFSFYSIKSTYIYIYIYIYMHLHVIFLYRLAFVKCNYGELKKQQLMVRNQM
jgi:hypothetical protein